MREGFEDAEEADDDQAVTDADVPVSEVIPERVGGIGEADQQESPSLDQVGDGILDEAI